MTASLDAQMDLVRVISDLNKYYYTPVQELFESKASIFNNAEAEALAAQLDVLNKYIDHRLNVFVPYVYELDEKSRSGHNCKTCSGSCDAQHSLKIAEFIGLMQAMKNVAIEWDSVKTEKNVQGALQEINQKLDALLYLEEFELLTRVKEAQRKINVIS